MPRVWAQFIHQSGADRMGLQPGGLVQVHPEGTEQYGHIDATGGGTAERGGSSITKWVKLDVDGAEYDEITKGNRVMDLSTEVFRSGTDYGIKARHLESIGDDAGAQAHEAAMKSFGYGERK